MFRALISWMDRKQAANDYVGGASVAERMIWTAPFVICLLLISVLETLGMEREHPAITTLMVLGMVGFVVVFCIWLYVWARGYVRPDVQERLASAQRERNAQREANSWAWMRRKDR